MMVIPTNRAVHRPVTSEQPVRDGCLERQEPHNGRARCVKPVPRVVCKEGYYCPDDPAGNDLAPDRISPDFPQNSFHLCPYNRALPWASTTYQVIRRVSTQHEHLYMVMLFITYKKCARVGKRGNRHGEGAG